MRRLLSVFCHAEPRSGIVMPRATLWSVAGVVAVGGALALTQAFAKDPDEQPEARPNSKLRSANASGHAEEARIPECLQKLNLTQQQQAQAKEVIQKYDGRLGLAWKQFGDKYMETVRTEVALLSAVEDNLTESQRTQVREQRRRVAWAEKMAQGAHSKPGQANERPNQPNEKSNPATGKTAKPADPVEEIVSGTGISLTPEQEAAGDKIHQKYMGQLRSLNREIQGIHNQLVSLEADKYVELEKLLTKEQLMQLRDDRQTAGPQKVTANDKASKSND